MYLNNATVRELLAKCLFGKNWQKYIGNVIPRKGNFLNPQYLTKTGTYAVYYIEKKEKRVVNHQSQYSYEEDGGYHEIYADIKCSVKVQFIGKKAEEWATSLMFWDEREDVQKVFLEYQSTLLQGDRTIVAVPFQQEGYNGEMSYLASFDTISNAAKGEIDEYLTDLIVFEGSLKVEK